METFYKTVNSTSRVDRISCWDSWFHSDQWMKLAGTRLGTKWERSSRRKQEKTEIPSEILQISLYRFERNLDKHLENRFIMACPANSPHRVQRTRAENSWRSGEYCRGLTVISPTFSCFHFHSLLEAAGDDTGPDGPFVWTSMATFTFLRLS